MSPKDEEFIRFYRDEVIAGHNEPALRLADVTPGVNPDEARLGVSR
jgi:hypothetical protein